MPNRCLKNLFQSIWLVTAALVLGIAIVQMGTVHPAHWLAVLFRSYVVAIPGLWLMLEGGHWLFRGKLSLNEAVA